tara:strand:- start:43941 stop:44120 length:180 start_codon:yes stop_codon:yes gene_type:complete
MKAGSGERHQRMPLRAWILTLLGVLIVATGVVLVVAGSCESMFMCPVANPDACTNADGR